MDTNNLAVFVLAALLFSFSLFTSVSADLACSHGSIVYTREQLMALHDTAVLPKGRPDIPRDLRRRKRQGSCAGRERRARRRRYKPVLPSIIMGNVRSLPNKMDELTQIADDTVPDPSTSRQIHIAVTPVIVRLTV